MGLNKQFRERMLELTMKAAALSALEETLLRDGLKHTLETARGCSSGTLDNFGHLHGDINRVFGSHSEDRREVAAISAWSSLARGAISEVMQENCGCIVDPGRPQSEYDHYADMLEKMYGDGR